VVGPRRSGRKQPLQICATCGPSGHLAGVWFGVLVLAAVAGWLGPVGLLVLCDAGDLSNGLAAARGRIVGPALIVMVAALLLAERRLPAVQRPLLARAHLVDAGYLPLFSVIVVRFLALVETGFAVEVERHARFLLLGQLPLAPRDDRQPHLRWSHPTAGVPSDDSGRATGHQRRQRLTGTGWASETSVDLTGLVDDEHDSSATLGRLCSQSVRRLGRHLGL
jgi:hypothetical protein